jgi:hypothetical protein
VKSKETPWKVINSVNTKFLALVLVLFILGLIQLTLLRFNSQAIFLSLIFLELGVVYLIIRVCSLPCPCPNCGKPFLAINIKNIPKFLSSAVKNSINPINYFAFMFDRTCPHCGLAYGSEVTEETDPSES